EASLHHLEVGQDQLGLEVFDVAPWRGRVQRRVRERTHVVEQGIGVPEFFGVEAGSLALGDAGQVDHVEGRDGRLLRLEERAETIDPRVPDASHARVELDAGGVVARRGDTGAGEQVEQRGLAASRQADQADLHESIMPRARLRRVEMPASDSPTPYRAIDLRGAAGALLASLFWGVNPVAIKAGLEDAPPFRLAALRFLLGGAVIVVWAARTGRLRGFRVAPDEWRPLGVLGLLLALQMCTMNVAPTMAPPAPVPLLLILPAVQPVVRAPSMIRGDRLSLRLFVGVLVAFGGIVVLFGRGFSLGGPTLVGDAIMFSSALILAERTIYLPRA